MNKNYLINLSGLLIIGISLYLLSSCTKKNEIEDVFKTNPNTCDSTNVTYNFQMKSILNSNCATGGCHLNGSQNPDLNTYENCMTYLLQDPSNGTFLYEKVVEGQHNSGNLTSCDKIQLKKWIEKPLP